jgi:membrane associated rhomboid family serine protease
MASEKDAEKQRSKSASLSPPPDNESVARYWIGYLTSMSTATREALFVGFGLLGVCLVLQIANSADHYRLTAYFGLRPRSVASLPDFVLSCFVHFSWEHLAGNSVFLVIFGFLAAYQGLGKFVGVTLAVMITSNLYWWSFGPEASYSAGSSGMIWGWISYSLVRGTFHRKELGRIAIVMLAMFYGLAGMALIFPGPSEWQAHLGGLVGGVLCGWALRNRPQSLTRDHRPRATCQVTRG